MSARPLRTSTNAAEDYGSQGAQRVAQVREADSARADDSCRGRPPRRDQPIRSEGTHSRDFRRPLARRTPHAWRSTPCLVSRSVRCI